MSNTIKNTSKLPNWFDLKKYESVRELDSKGWYYQLLIRKTVYLILHTLKQQASHSAWEDIRQSRDQEKVNETYEHAKRQYAEITEEIRKNPIVDMNSNKYFQTLCNISGLKTLKQNSTETKKGLHSLTINELLVLIQCLEPSKREYLLKRYNQICNNEQSINIDKEHPKQPWFDDPVSQHLSPYQIRSDETIKINLYLPDEILINQFKKNIKLLREKKNISLHSKNREWQHCFDKWINLGVLPFLDLETWAYEKNFKIPNRVMADVIFLSENPGEETVRKTTSPLAYSLLSDDSIEQLKMLAGFEITEKNIV